MKRLACCAIVLTLAASCDALALGSLADVTVIDRDSGTALSTYYFRGEYWVAGRPGARYAIEIRNCIGGRLLAVTSVDGVNVISGATAGWDQSGYVFDPGQRYQITGGASPMPKWPLSPSPSHPILMPSAPGGRRTSGSSAWRSSVNVTHSRCTRPPGSLPTRETMQPLRPARPAAPRWSRRRLRRLPERVRQRTGYQAACRRRRLVPRHRWRHRPPQQSSAPATASANTPMSRIRNSGGCRPSRTRSSAFAMTASTIWWRWASSGAPRPTPASPDPFPGSQQRQFVPDPPG